MPPIHADDLARTVTYLLPKWVHVLSSTMLFGFGAGTAWYLWSAHRAGDPATIASVGRMVVRADWIFTDRAGDPAAQRSDAAPCPRLTESWVLASVALYLIAFACWCRWSACRCARRSSPGGAGKRHPLRDDYRRTMRTWFWLGWPAFLGLLVVFRLMIAKPQLW